MCSGPAEKIASEPLQNYSFPIKASLAKVLLLIRRTCTNLHVQHTYLLPLFRQDTSQDQWDWFFGWVNVDILQSYRAPGTSGKMEEISIAILRRLSDWVEEQVKPCFTPSRRESFATSRCQCILLHHPFRPEESGQVWQSYNMDGDGGTLQASNSGSANKMWRPGALSSRRIQALSNS